jgi:hypothetical protein
LIQRVAYRFAVVYLGLFCFASQFAGGLCSSPALFPRWHRVADVRIPTGSARTSSTSNARRRRQRDTPFHWVCWRGFRGSAVIAIAPGCSGRFSIG